MPAQAIISYTQAAGTPLTGGKAFFVSDVSGSSWNAWNLQYPPDSDGISRLYTTVTLALAQTVAGRGDYIELASDFSTAVTAAELLSAETNGVQILQFGKQLGTRWVAERATANFPQSTSYDLFTVTGRVRIREIVGTITTIAASTTNLTNLFANPTVPTGSTLTTTALSAAGSTYGLITEGLLTITGTLSAKLVTTPNGAVIDQAAAVIVPKGTIRLKSTASVTGKAKWRIEYEPIDPGARIFPA